MNEANSIPDELLTAYLDDELTADERDRVRRAIERDPELHANLDQLRSIQATVRALPRFHPPEQFADALLDKIAAASRDRSPHASPQNTKSTPGTKSKPPLMISAVAVGIVGIAAALLVAVWIGQNGSPTDLASVPATMERSDAQANRSIASANSDPGQDSAADEDIAFAENGNLPPTENEGLVASSAALSPKIGAADQPISEPLSDASPLHRSDPARRSFDEPAASAISAAPSIIPQPNLVDDIGGRSARAMPMTVGNAKPASQNGADPDNQVIWVSLIEKQQAAIDKALKAVQTLEVRELPQLDGTLENANSNDANAEQQNPTRYYQVQGKRSDIQKMLAPFQDFVRFAKGADAFPMTQLSKRGPLTRKSESFPPDPSSAADVLEKTDSTAAERTMSARTETEAQSEADEESRIRVILIIESITEATASSIDSAPVTQEAGE